MNKRQVPNTFRYTPELLTEYRENALSNARNLITESSLLFENRHFGRSYFLAVAAIEEVGKAYILYDALRRELQDSAVTAKIRNSIENHSQKISSAFIAFMQSIDKAKLRENLQHILDLLIALKHGREPSMYTDLNYENGTINTPEDAVREVAAKDCNRLAKQCLGSTESYISKGQSRRTNSHEDAFYAMKSQKTVKLFNNRDFWEFYISRLEQGNDDVAETVVLYERNYLSKSKTFEENT